MTRLAYISFDQVPAPKGASTHIEAFVRGLAARFGGVDLATVGPSSFCERWPGVRHWELPATGVSLIDRVLSFRNLLDRWLAGRLYDVIHFRSIFEGLPIVRGRKGAALVFEVNGLPSIELKYRYPGCEDDRELMRKLVLQERACVQAADLIVTPSPVTQKFLLEKREAAKVAVVPNGVDLSVFRGGPIAFDGPLLYFGTLSSWQGVDLAIRAVAQTGDSLTILGTGSKSQREGLRRLADKLGARVSLKAAVSQTELATELAGCFAVVAPLAWNDRNVVQGCCPLKVLEGMAAGRPVIASDLEVVRDLGARHDDHLLMTKPGSVDGIAEAIIRMRGDQVLAARLGVNGRQLIEEQFTWGRSVRTLVEAYEAVLEDVRLPARS